jgi:hypothetical protein
MNAAVNVADGAASAAAFVLTDRAPSAAPARHRPSGTAAKHRPESTAARKALRRTNVVGLTRDSQYESVPVVCITRGYSSLSRSIVPYSPVCPCAWM